MVVCALTPPPSHFFLYFGFSPTEGADGDAGASDGQNKASDNACDAGGAAWVGVSLALFLGHAVCKLGLLGCKKFNAGARPPA